MRLRTRSAKICSPSNLENDNSDGRTSGGDHAARCCTGSQKISLRNPIAQPALQQAMLISEIITLLHTSISQSKNLVSNLKAFLGVTAKALNGPRELHAQRLRRMGGNRVHPHPLQKVHAVQAECFDFDDGICRLWLRFGSLVVDEQSGGRSRALAFLDV